MYDYTSHIYSVDIRYSVLYYCRWRVRSLKRQFSLWTLESNTTHCSTGAVKYSCRKTTLQQNAAAGETTPSLRKPLFNSSLSRCPFLPHFLIMLFFSLYTSEYHPLFLCPFQSFSHFCFFFFYLLHSLFWHVYLYDLNMYIYT